MTDIDYPTCPNCDEPRERSAFKPNLPPARSPRYVGAWCITCRQTYRERTRAEATLTGICAASGCTRPWIEKYRSSRMCAECTRVGHIAAVPQTRTDARPSPRPRPEVVK